MRILYFSRDYNVHDHRFLTALADTPHQVAFLRLEKGSGGPDEYSLPQDIEVIPWKGGKKPYQAADKVRLVKDLQRVVDDYKPDVLHAGPLHLSAYLAAQTGFQPLVSMSWGYDLLYDAQRDPVVKTALRFTLQNSAVMVGDCQTIRRLAVSYGIPDERVITFPWGIDLERFGPFTSNERFNHPQFTLLSTRGWEPIYGIDVIAQAFSLAARLAPELRLVMLGSGSQAENIRHILGDAGVLERVSFPGSVSQAELPEYYRSADLYLSASHSDGTSISLLEALASGTPALVSDISGNREWIEPGVHGWWFPDGNPQALAQMILSSFRQRQIFHSISSACRKLAEQRADWKINFPRLLDAYAIALNVHDLS
jgi:glycosyltransferase involved in cell wall biosynthesis